MQQNGTKLGEPVPVLGLLWDENEDVWTEIFGRTQSSCHVQENFVKRPQDFLSNWIFMTSDTVSKASDIQQLEPQVRLG